LIGVDRALATATPMQHGRLMTARRCLALLLLLWLPNLALNVARCSMPCRAWRAPRSSRRTRTPRAACPARG
jgi:hypothetical protein